MPWPSAAPFGVDAAPAMPVVLSTCVAFVIEGVVLVSNTNIQSASAYKPMVNTTDHYSRRACVRLDGS